MFPKQYGFLVRVTDSSIPRCATGTLSVHVAGRKHCFSSRVLAQPAYHVPIYGIEVRGGNITRWRVPFGWIPYRDGDYTKWWY